MNDSVAPAGVPWRRVALFYGIALGWSVLIGGGLFLLGQRDLSTGMAPWAGAVLMLALMPVPMVAALITEKVDGRGYLITTLFARGFLRRLGRIAVVAVVTLALLIGVMVGLSWLVGNVIGLGGAGRLLVDTADIVANSLAVAGQSMDAASVAAITAATPPLGVLVLITFAASVAVGFTINGLVAFGEEYGWRGWLADALAPLGAVRANLLTGVMWGLWHAPIILLGYNYGGSYRLPGVVFMVLWCTAGSFLLWRARQLTDSVLAAAVIHGGINGFAGLFVVVLADPNRLIAAPMGLVGIATVAVVAALLWLVPTPARPALPEVAEAADSEAAAV